METIDLSKLSKEQLNAVLLQAEAIRKQENEKRQQDAEALVTLENDIIQEMYADARPISNAIVSFKQKYIGKLQPLIAMKVEHNKARADQETYSFKTIDNRIKTKLRNNRTNRYDDGIQAGIGYAKEWLTAQVDGAKSQQLISIIDDLLAKDNAGNYSPENLMKFVKKAEECGDELLLKASQSIKESIYEEMTSISLLMFEKDDLGIERSIPLSATKA